MNNADLIKAFANGATKGSNYTKSMYINGNVLYSYGEHYPLAVRAKGCFVGNSDSNSPTTNKQRNWARDILRIKQEIPTVELQNLARVMNKNLQVL